jgi:PGF-pre-PGF domain-containing protein
MKINFVALVVIISFLCIGSVSTLAAENVVPVASFSADVVSGKVPLQVQFTDTSSGEPTSWLWDFGDGSKSNLQNPAHTYMASGNYTVNLTVSNANGSDSLTRIDYISADTRPVVAIDYISPNPAIRGETVSLVGLYVYNYTAITRGNHEWYSNLVDGRLCPGRTLYTSILPVGNHTMSFRAKDSENQWSEWVYGYLVIQENTLPIATIDSITPNPAKVGEDITFSGTGIDPDGKSVSYEWRSSIDNLLSNQSSFSRSNLSVGTHTIDFKVKDHMSWSNVSTTVIVEGNTEYLQAGFVKTLSVNNPVDIKVNISGIDYVSADFSITDSTGAAVLEKSITENLVSGMYTFEWDATDQQGEPLPSGMYMLNLLSTDTSGSSISEIVAVTVDNTAPVIVIDDISGVITNEDVVYANWDLMVKVSESDGDVATVSIILSSDSGSPIKTIDANYEDGIWIGNFDLLSVPDGNYTVKVIAMDTAKNSNFITSDMVITVDRTAPVLDGVTPSNGQIFAEDATVVNIRFNYSDARTGINASSVSLTVDNIDVTSNATITGSYASYNATGLAAGSHSASIYVEDNAGNVQMFTTKFWIGPKPSQASTSTVRSGGSSGGGGATTGEKYENIQVKEVQGIFVNADSHINYEFEKEGNAITSVQFDALKNSGKIQAIVEVLKSRSSFAKADAPGKVYQQMNIWVGSVGFVSPENVENPRISFKVERSWLTENEINVDLVKLYRYADDSWDAVPTTLVGEDDRYMYFESHTPGFSPFAISSEISAKDAIDTSLRSADDTGTDLITYEEAGTVAATKSISTSTLLILGSISIMLGGAYVLYRKRS